MCLVVFLIPRYLKYERGPVICIAHYYVFYVFSCVLIPYYHSVNACLVILYYYEVGSALCMFSRNFDSL